MKEGKNEKGHEYLDLARELKKMWGMKIIVIDKLETIPKDLLRGLKELEFGNHLKKQHS